MTPKDALFAYCLKHADDRLVLGHRLSELCGHGPILEEDIATTNTALDLVGQATLLYEYAAEIKGEGMTADKLAFFRNEREYRNLLLCEQDNIDFAYMTCRQFFFDAYDHLFLQELTKTNDERLRGFAERSLKEAVYHLRHSSQWMLMLGDGTDESRGRLAEAVDFLWSFTGELFETDEADKMLIEIGLAPDTSMLRDRYYETVNKVLTEATLEPLSPDAYMHTGGRNGIHTEGLGIMLAVMQSLPRAMPEAEW